MSSTTAPLTPLQLEVLDVLKNIELGVVHAPQPTTRWIAVKGRLLYGPDWAGAHEVLINNAIRAIHPSLNRTLGVLSQRGLVERIGPVHRYGLWELTHLAREVLGMNPFLSD